VVQGTVNLIDLDDRRKPWQKTSAGAALLYQVNGDFICLDLMMFHHHTPAVTLCALPQMVRGGRLLCTNREGLEYCARRSRTRRQDFLRIF